MPTGLSARPAIRQANRPQACKKQGKQASRQTGHRHAGHKTQETSDTLHAASYNRTQLHARVEPLARHLGGAPLRVALLARLVRLAERMTHGCTRGPAARAPSTG